MRFAIVSDTHDNLANLEKVVAWCNWQGILTMLHCGDICRRQTMQQAEEQFKGQIFFVRGNGDYGLDEVPETLALDLGGRRVFFNHYPDVAKKAAESGKYDLAFYGHTHKPWAQQIGKCTLANPGELANQRYKPTFAVYDTETNKLELKILDTFNLA